MKYIIRVLAIAVVISIFVIALSYLSFDRTTDVAVKPTEGLISLEEIQEHPLGRLLDAIEWVESGGDANVVGDNGRAVGAYQIHHCYLDDAVSCESEPYRFEDDDRYDKSMSREMVRRYLSRYATYWRLGRYPTNEDMARIHNGGPSGWKKESTKAYWEKVKLRMKRQLKGE